MTESERIKKLVDYHDVSVSKFSKQLGLSTPQILYDVIRGRNGMSKDLIGKIKANCVNIDPTWLITGEGSMLKEGGKSMNNTQRLKQLREYLGFQKDSEFARFLGIKSNVLSNWYTRGTFNSQLILQKCEFLNASWLLTGEGKMLKSSAEQDESSELKSLRKKHEDVLYELINAQKDLQKMSEKASLLEKKLYSSMRNQEDKKKEANPEKGT